MAIKKYGEEIYAGLETAWSLVADFLVAPGKYLQTRKLMVTDQGNPGQIFLRRAGPDGADPTVGFTKPESLPVGTNVGHIAWSAYELDEEQFGERLAQIHTRYQGKGKGSLHFSTSGVERLVITEDGELDLTGLATIYSNSAIAVRVGDKYGYIQIRGL